MPQTKEEKVAVEFLRPYRYKYCKGEIAVFSAADAEKLIKSEPQAARRYVKGK